MVATWTYGVNARACWRANCSHSSTFVSPTVGPTQVAAKEIVGLDRIVRRL
jgi:hypothetical protein